MKRGTITTALWGGLLAVSAAQAVYLDEAQTFQLTGKVFTQGSWRMTDSDSDGTMCYPFGSHCQGFTFPNTKTGQLIQHRNLLDAEIFHDVAKSMGPQFTFLDQLDYRVRVKWFYEGVYDYGPTQYREPSSALSASSIPSLAEIYRDGLLENRRLSTPREPLWNAYLDIGRNPVKVRIGRQDLSWGETDGFRLLDQIEPLDSRFGFPLVEDLDDRRIPLWMVRPTVSIGSIGPFKNLAVDGYWVPGTIDHQISPVAAPGNPFAVGAPPGPSTLIRPDKTLGNSRGGGRLIGTVGNVTFSIGHYVTFNDLPSVRLQTNGLAVPPIGTGTWYFGPNGQFLIEPYQQQITGASATFALPFDPYTIVRMEAAHGWDERVFKPTENLDAALPADTVGACLAQVGTPNLFCPDVAGIGGLPTKNIMRWMIGLDRNVWIRWLNPENTFYLSGQYFHTNIFNFDRGIANAVPSSTHLDPLAPGAPIMATTLDWVSRRNDEMTFTYLINTLVWHGTIQPQVFAMYDARGVNAAVPSLSYQWGTNLVLTMKYAIVRGNFVNLGFFRDRDQLLLRVQYNLS